jgi:hypothetical protein
MNQDADINEPTILSEIVENDPGLTSRLLPRSRAR